MNNAGDKERHANHVKTVYTYIVYERISEVVLLEGIDGQDKDKCNLFGRITKEKSTLTEGGKHKICWQVSLYNGSWTQN